MKAPKCRFCGENHWGNCTFYRDVATKVATAPKKVATISPAMYAHVEKVVTIPMKGDNVATIRKVSIRELNRGISAHFSNLPFLVTRNGKVVARVDKV